jgi:uncharacterized lipoprotein YddW (UPF0748 family)
MEQVKILLTKSLIGSKKDQIATAHSLGLRKIGDSITAEKDDDIGLSADHPARLHPEWTVPYTDGRMYWDPGFPEVQQLIADGVSEIVNNYNIDGIHIDDYFYPGVDFNDSTSFAAYGSSYASLADFRYANTEKTVKNMYDIVHRSNKGIVFGFIPMGIWANKTTNPSGSNTKGGEGYVQRFADARGWVKRGIVDYIAPQIYWNIGYEIADYEILLDWWANVVSGTNVRLYIGQAAYRTDPGSCDPAYESAHRVYGSCFRRFSVCKQQRRRAGVF